MDAVQTHYPLTLHALFTDLRDFPTTTLQTALYFTQVDTAHCWVPPRGAGRLNQVRLEVLPRTRPQRLDISVYCGSVLVRSQIKSLWWIVSVIYRCRSNGISYILVIKSSFIFPMFSPLHLTSSFFFIFFLFFCFISASVFTCSTISFSHSFLVNVKLFKEQKRCIGI